MKKFLLTLWVLFVVIVTHGRGVDADAAKVVGYNYLKHRGAASISSANDLKLIYTSMGRYTYFYVFGNDSCFVMVSADDGVKPILAFSFSNGFSAQLPDNVRYFLENYNKQIDYVISRHIQPSPDVESFWDDARNNTLHATASKTTAGSVSPLLTTKWGQGTYYNDLCPTIVVSGMPTHTLTGCVATSMAQVMNYWGWPCIGTGSHSYEPPATAPVSSDFGSHQYEWNAMPVTASGPCHAVAQLMFDAGVSVDMDYNTTGSGAYVSLVPPALKTYFNYDPALHSVYRSSYSSTTAWESLLINELNEKRPIIFSGYPPTGGTGHTWVMDGYDAPENTFHMNWGWDGSADGDFTITDLTPGSYDFSAWQSAIIGIRPNYALPHMPESDRICKCIPGTLFINHTSTIAPGGVYKKDIVMAGGSVASGGDYIVTVDPDEFTYFLGSYIVVEDRFEAKVNNVRIFEIVPIPYCDESEPGDGRPAGNHEPVDLEYIVGNSVDKAIVVYPNPTNSNITIAYPCKSAGQLTIGIKDVSGRVRYSENVLCNEGANVQHVVDMTAFSPGVYFVDLTLNDQHVVKKIVKI